MTRCVAQHNSPDWAVHRLSPNWWNEFHDDRLSCDIETAFSKSPDLQVIAARIEQADAAVRVAQVAAWPNLNAGYGFRLGRNKDFGFDPHDLKPWTGAAALSWELDVFKKLRQARESAEYNRKAMAWDLAAARLVLATRIAEARFRIYRLRKEVVLLTESIDANAEILGILRDREKAGLVSMTFVYQSEGEHEKLTRDREELKRLELVGQVELDTLRGGHDRGNDARGDFPAIPKVPSAPFADLLCSHPSILAAEARVRSAFKIEEYSRLNLLPSFTLTGNLMGASPHFFLDQFGTWERMIGPSLDIPVFDPARQATLCLNRGKTDEAVASYRSTLVGIIGDIDAAYINLRSRKLQLESAVREVKALSGARTNVTANLKAGVVSQVEVLESERSYLQSKRALVALEELALNDHIALIRSLGGGCVPQNCEPGPRATPVTMAQFVPGG